MTSRRRRRPGDGPGEIHCAVHDHTAIRHFILLPVCTGIVGPFRRRHPSIAISAIDQLRKLFLEMM